MKIFAPMLLPFLMACSTSKSLKYFRADNLKEGQTAVVGRVDIRQGSLRNGDCSIYLRKIGDSRPRIRYKLERTGLLAIALPEREFEFYSYECSNIAHHTGHVLLVERPTFDLQEVEEEGPVYIGDISIRTRYKNEKLDHRLGKAMLGIQPELVIDIEVTNKKKRTLRDLKKRGKIKEDPVIQIAEIPNV